MPRSILPLALLALLLGASPAAAQQVPVLAVAGTPSAHATAIVRARQMIRDSMSAEGIPGLSVAVAVDGQVVWSEGFGFADLENGIPVTTATRLRIGSVSKSVTSAAVGRLVQEGRLDLDAPVQRYVPAFPVKRHPISTRQVAGHLAGIRHYRGTEMLSMAPYASVTASLDIFKDDSLLHEPGTRYLYSSYGWNLISAVVEGAAGVPFLTYMHRAVFEPLGLRSIIAEHPDSLILHRARFYERGPDGALLNAPYVDNSYKWAGGGFLSNTEDLVRFGSAMLDDRLLADSTRRQLFAPMRTRAGEDTRYALGWRSYTDADGRLVHEHSGGSVGANAFLVLYPASRVVVAVLGNSRSRFVGGGSGARAVAGLFMQR